MAFSIERKRFGRSSATRGWLEAKYIEYLQSLTNLPQPDVPPTPKKELTPEQKRAVGSNIIKTFRDMPDSPMDAHDHNLSEEDAKEMENVVPDWAQH